MQIMRIIRSLAVRLSLSSVLTYAMFDLPFYCDNSFVFRSARDKNKLVGEGEKGRKEIDLNAT